MTDEPPIHEQLFHRCALVAFAEEMARCGGQPESNAVRRRAYSLYEEELRRKNAAKPGSKSSG